jgi:hypothetical protein
MGLNVNSEMITAGLDSFDVIKCAPSAFAGGTTNARGDKDGTNASYKLFNVTGDVLVRIYGVCTTTLVGAGTIEVGITGNTALLLPQVSDATTIAANDVWIDATVGEVGGALLSNIPATTLITNGLDIYEKVASTDVTSGNIYYVCMWKPVVPGSKVESAI